MKNGEKRSGVPKLPINNGKLPGKPTLHIKRISILYDSQKIIKYKFKINKNMKSLKRILAIAFIALFTATATAQKNPDKAAKVRTKVMVVQLKLNKQQKQKLLALNKKMIKDRKSLKGKGKSIRDNARKTYKAELKQILTAEQYNTWKTERREQ